MSKKNIGATLALYPSPLIVVGAMVEGKPTWTLVAHAGTMAHSHLMVSLVQAGGRFLAESGGSYGHDQRQQGGQI